MPSLKLILKLFRVLFIAYSCGQLETIRYDNRSRTDVKICMRLQTLTYRRWLYESFWTVLSLFIAGLFYKEVQSSAWRSNSIRPAKTAVSPLIVAPRRWGRFARRNGCFRRLQFPVLLPILLGYVCTLPDSFRAGTKIIPDGATIHTQERLWRRDYCDWAKLCAAAISKVERHISGRCSHYTGQLLMLSVAVTSLVGA